VRSLFTFILFFCVIWPLIAQEPDTEKKITENGSAFYLHKVKPGETLFSVSKKYEVDLKLLYEANPQATNGLKSGEVLKVPVVEKKETASTTRDQHAPVRVVSHKVQKKETLYYIARKYGVTIDDILEYNPGLTQLKKGESLRIPQWADKPVITEKELPAAQTGRDSQITHFVQPGETLYSISRKYGKSVSLILESNPEAKELKPGMRLTIPATASQPEKTTASEEYREHTIQPGETLFYLSRKFNISAEQLVEMNPSLAKTCKVGTLIRIPVKVAASSSPAGKNGKVGVRHVVKPGETLYGLSQEYQLSMGEIIRSNPFLEQRPPHTGDTLVIMSGGERGKFGENVNDLQEKPESGFSSECIPGKISNHGKTYRVALLLPLMLETNRALNSELLNGEFKEEDEAGISVSDTLRTGKKSVSQMQFHGNSENYLHFYEGVLLAIDSLQQMRINLDLDVLDTEQKSSKIKSFLSSGVLRNTDLIIGPVYPNEQKEIAEYAMKNKIPMVSPLSPSDDITKGNPFCFQVNPTKEYISGKTTEYLVSAFKGSQILILQTDKSGNEAESVASELKDKIAKSNGVSHSTTVKICNFSKDGFVALRDDMNKDRKNVIVVPSGNEADVSVVVSNMKSLVSAGYDITLIGNSRFSQYESINPDHYHHSQLEFLTPYWPDMSQPVTHSFINKFRLYYKTEPNQYSMQGYVVTFFFMKALSDFGKDFRDCIGDEKAGLVQGTYHFVRVPSGGFVNNGLSVIQYLPSYEIIRKRVFTH